MKIATRKSPLALWQANYVKSALEQRHPGLRAVLVPMSTRGDAVIDRPLRHLGGKGLFVSELEAALGDGRADIAVHSMKDMPSQLPPGLALAVVCEGDDPRDAFVCNRHARLADLPASSVVGTSSPRRQCQLRRLRPDLRVMDLRGNVGTRLGKLDAGVIDGIILAAAGLRRLGLVTRIRQPLSVDDFLPAAGQGAIGIECRLDDRATRQLIGALHHPETAARVTAERAVVAELEAGCGMPVASHAEVTGRQLSLRATVGTVDGATVLRAGSRGDLDDAAELGRQTAQELLEQGAEAIMSALR